MILFNKKSLQFILVIAAFKNSIWGWICQISCVFVIRDGALVQQLTFLNDYWKVNPYKPFNKGTTSSEGMRKTAARCQKNWIMILTSESLLLVVQQILHLYTMVNQKDVSYPYYTTCFVLVIQGNIYPICELSIVGSDAFGCWMCIFISRNSIAHAYFHINIALSTFEKYIERYGMKITNKYWTDLRVFLRDWRRVFIDHWSDSRSKNFHVFSFFTIWNFSLCFCFPFSILDNEKCQ